jgi:hypothetical protein
MNSIKLSNEFDDTMNISFEPEGEMFQLHSQEELEIILVDAIDTSIDIQIREKEGNIYLSVWPEKSTYKVSYKGKEIHP